MRDNDFTVFLAFCMICFLFIMFHHTKQMPLCEYNPVNRNQFSRRSVGYDGRDSSGLELKFRSPNISNYLLTININPLFSLHYSFHSRYSFLKDHVDDN